MRALCLLLILSLASGCTRAPHETETPTITTTSDAPPGASPAATPTPDASPPPAATPPAPAPTPTPPPGNASKTVTWSYTVSAAPRTGSIPAGEGNCVQIPAARILGGNVTASWGDDAPVSTTDLDLVISRGEATARATGRGPLVVEFPTSPRAEETDVAMFLTDAFQEITVPRPSQVELVLVFLIPATDGEPGEPGASTSCPYPGSA